MQRPGLAAQPHLAGHEPLALVDEGVERLLQGREPQPVVDQLGVAGLEPGLLVGQVALEGQILEVGVGHDQRQGAGALVDLAALDADPAVLDHVDAAPAVGADDLGRPRRSARASGSVAAVDARRAGPARSR